MAPQTARCTCSVDMLVHVHVCPLVYMYVEATFTFVWCELKTMLLFEIASDIAWSSPTHKKK